MQKNALFLLKNYKHRPALGARPMPPLAGDFPPDLPNWEVLATTMSKTTLQPAHFRIIVLCWQIKISTCLYSFCCNIWKNVGKWNYTHLYSNSPQLWINCVAIATDCRCENEINSKLPST